MEPRSASGFSFRWAVLDGRRQRPSDGAGAMDWESDARERHGHEHRHRERRDTPESSSATTPAQKATM
jgi:hypothetical protein